MREPPPQFDRIYTATNTGTSNHGWNAHAHGDARFTGFHFLQRIVMVKLFQDPSISDQQTFFKSLTNDYIYILFLALVGTIGFWITAHAWPFAPGRDFERYLTNTINVDGFNFGSNADGILTNFLMSYLLDSSYTIVESFTALGYFLSLFTMYYVGLIFGRTVARVASFIVLLNLQVPVFLHSICSDPFAFIGLHIWLIIVVRYYRINNIASSIIIGCASFFLVTIRLPYQLFIFSALIPIICHRVSIRTLYNSLIIFMTFCLLWISYAWINKTRHNTFSVNPYQIGYVLSYNIFYFNKSMSEKNGPHSARLAELTREHLLSKPYYQDNAITLESFFGSPQKEFYSEMYLMAERFEPGIVNKAALETIMQHPKKFIRRFFQLIEWGLRQPFKPDMSQCAEKSPESNQNKSASSATRAPNYFTEENSQTIIPPDVLEKAHRIKEQRTLIFKERKVACDTAQSIIKYNFNLFPSMLYFWILSAFILLFYKHIEIRLLFCFLTPCASVTILSFTTQSPWANYRMPFDGLFILSGIVGLLSILQFIALFVEKKSLQGTQS
ncbi:MAG: hypothetical protein HQL97_05350 [Magnetococcales bacterium]|nr:hypothetical protein [Magnetococcales bacterium]